MGKWRHQWQSLRFTKIASAILDSNQLLRLLDGKQESQNLKSDCSWFRNEDMGASAVLGAAQSCSFSGGSVWIHIENFKTSVWIHIQFASKENFTNPGKVRCNTSPQNWEELRGRCCNEHLPKFILHPWEQVKMTVGSVPVIPQSLFMPIVARRPLLAYWIENSY